MRAQAANHVMVELTILHIWKAGQSTIKEAGSFLDGDLIEAIQLRMKHQNQEEQREPAWSPASLAIHADDELAFYERNL